MKIEKLCYGSYTAKINVSRGGNCISLRNSQYDCQILREPDYEMGIDNPYVYGMPVLFPVNRISGGAFEYENRKYSFPINEEQTNCFLHGMLHELAMEIKEREEHRIVLLYKATKDTPYLTFPHEFEVWMEYSLTDNGLLHEVKIRNLSNENMPVLLGFHTTFQIPFIRDSSKEEIVIRADIAEEYERDKFIHVPTGKILDYDAISQNLANGEFVPNIQISRHYRKGESGIMSITDTKYGIAVVYENCPEFAYRLIFGQGSDFICLEPQTCIVDCVNSPFPKENTGFIYLEPGNEIKLWSKIGVNSAMKCAK